MIKYEDVRIVHLELSTNCNARCILCPRNFHGYPLNSGYPETSLSLDNIKQIFEVEFIRRLKRLFLNGNFGDFMLAPDAIEIIKYFQRYNPIIFVSISTNGSARTADFWQELGTLNNIEIIFALDGLADTHALYRADTHWHKIIENAQTFMKAGGRAVWKMIEFDHNRHQIEECRALAKSLGFSDFDLVSHGRNQGAAYDRQGNFTHVIGSEDPNKYKTYHKNLEDVYIHFPGIENYPGPVYKKINCETKIDKTIYISANGDVSPCCYLGLMPKTYELKRMYGLEQVRELIGNEEINALKRPLRECLEWFNRVEETWNKNSFKEGRLWRCNHHCGDRNS